MRIVIAGGHGKVALLLARQLANAGHTAVGIIRNPNQAADLADSVVMDITSASLAEVTAVLTGADAAVFSAGAGGGGDSARTLAVDQHGAILFADAAVAAGVRRFIMVSSAGADNFDAASDDGFQVYLRAKSTADASIRTHDLDWTIVRPVTLADTVGTGLVMTGDTVPHSEIPRADVAAIVAELVTSGAAVGVQFEVTSGEVPVAEALRAL